MIGIELIARERLRQVELEEWSPEHDNEHTGRQLAAAAACYAAAGARDDGMDDIDVTVRGVPFWPWDKKRDKRKQHDQLRCLIIAGALCAAEIDRLHRASTPQGEGGGE